MSRLPAALHILLACRYLICAACTDQLNAMGLMATGPLQETLHSPYHMIVSAR